MIGEIVIVLGVMLLVKLFGLVRRTSRATTVARSALAVVRDPSLGDREKEAATQKYAKELFVLLLGILAASVLALAIPLGVVWAMELANLLTVSEVIAGTLTPQFIGVVAALSVILFLLRKKLFG